MVPTALFGWPLVVIVLFSLIGPRRAVLVGLLGGWLFLPMAGYQVAGLPDYDKVFACSAGVLIGTLLFSTERLATLRFRWWDLPMVIWCITPFFSCVSAGLGVYAGLSAVFSSVITWGIPYGLGRVFFRNWGDMRELALAIVIAGAVYAPFCLYEIRMSPQLHTMVYGFHQHVFAQTRRWGGWRPVVFMQHGLAVGAWMSTAALLASWLAGTKAVSKIAGMPAWLVAGVLVVVAVLCKSTGAIALGLIGGGILACSVSFRSYLPVLMIAVMCLTYMLTRGTGVWDGQQLVDVTSRVSAARAASLQTRFANEDRIVSRVQSNLLFGYGWGQFLAAESGNKDTTPDGFWVLMLGRYGVIGLTSVTLVFLLPGYLLLRRLAPIGAWTAPSLSIVLGLVTVLYLHLVDNLFNAMVNPVFVLTAGAISSLAGRVPTSKQRRHARKGTRRRTAKADIPAQHRAVSRRLQGGG
jgi:hypothetical protein